HGKLPADLVGAAPRHANLAAGKGDRPVHLADSVLVEQSIGARRGQHERSLLGALLHRRAEAGRKAAPLESAGLGEAINAGARRAGLSESREKAGCPPNDHYAEGPQQQTPGAPSSDATQDFHDRASFQVPGEAMLFHGTLSWQ